MVYAKFAGQTECIMGNSKIENSAQTYCHVLSMFCTFVFRNRVLMEFLIIELLFWALKILIKGIETRLNN